MMSDKDKQYMKLATWVVDGTLIVLFSGTGWIVQDVVYCWLTGF